ncbi:hypothetical protein EYF80_052337 [Liparis tanakae]|uniref:Uncharacterized protein n=1 Tax=Liparis tanakae TaxID=230148 RepID=A0A4Z2F9G5_9TELE|nr:hypothetical protein EYF80_052337 [Liparis tanakae]
MGRGRGSEGGGPLCVNVRAWLHRDAGGRREKTRGDVTSVIYNTDREGSCDQDQDQDQDREQTCSRGFKENNGKKGNNAHTTSTSTRLSDLVMLEFGIWRVRLAVEVTTTVTGKIRITKRFQLLMLPCLLIGGVIAAGLLHGGKMRHRKTQ